MKLIKVLFIIVSLFTIISCGTTSNIEDVNIPPVEPILPEETVDEISQSEVKLDNEVTTKNDSENTDFFEVDNDNVEASVNVESEEDVDNIDNIIEPEISDEIIIHNDYETQPIEPKDSVFLEEFSEGLEISSNLISNENDTSSEKKSSDTPVEVVEPEFHNIEEVKTTDEIIPVASSKKAVVKKVQRQTSNIDIVEKKDTTVTEEKNTSKPLPKKSNKTVKNTTIIEEPEVQFAVVDSSIDDSQKDFNNLSAENLLKEAEKFYKMKKYEKALQYLDKFFLISVSDFDKAWFLRGNIYEAFSDFTNIKKAKEAYETLVSLYPQSEYWDEAQERIAYINKFYFSIY